MAERQKVSKLRGLSRRSNKGKVKIEKQVKVKNGYLTITFPLTAEQVKVLDLFTDYMLSFVYGDRSMANPENVKEWAIEVEMYMDKLFGMNSYKKCFGDSVASHVEIGELFGEITKAVQECKEEVRQLRKITGTK